MSFGNIDPRVMLNACVLVWFGHDAAAVNGSPRYIHAASLSMKRGGGIVLRICIRGCSVTEMLFS